MMNSSTQTSDGDIKLNSDLFNLAEKLQIQLHEKDKELKVKDEENKIELQKKNKELAKEKQEKQKLSADLEFEKARANRAVTELANAQGKLDALQLRLWKSFPSAGASYYIKIPVQSGSQNGQFLYAFNDSGNYCLLSSDGYNDQSPSEFKFTKNSDGTFSIYYTINKLPLEKYLQINTYSSRVEFTGKNDSAEKFVLFHQQNQQSGFLVDIGTLAGSFLCMKNNFVVANSRTSPADKFLIIPVGVQ